MQECTYDITSFKLKHLGREVLDDALAVDELLEEEASDRDHGEAAVLELLGSHLGEFLRVRGLEAGRVEADVAGVVLVLEAAERRVIRKVGERAVRRVRARRRRPARERARDLGEADAKHEDLEEDGHLGADLVEVADGRADVLVAEAEEGVERLLHEEAQRREHRHAAVRDLGLAEHLQLRDGLALREARGVEVAHGRQRAREARHEFRLVGRPAVHRRVLRRLRLLLNGGRAQRLARSRVLRRHKSGSTSEGESDDNRLHGC
ncbi:unnamed protein product [Pelagomonas calceolata]|uniref:Uncharacterized protein n=1 Tax=Pelagomonas calceolata TaxID=35677 RepID=A0A8J2SXC7_9STRA|nr:unnamed protein product [Pelagomonas calceolata]